LKNGQALNLTIQINQPTELIDFDGSSISGQKQNTLGLIKIKKALGSPLKALAIINLYF